MFFVSVLKEMPGQHPDTEGSTSVPSGSSKLDFGPWIFQRENIVPYTSAIYACCLTPRIFLKA
jgi:hypothetical protein